MSETLDKVLSNYEGKQSEIIPILQDIQDAFGYLPLSSLKAIARFVKVSESQVYGTATFYTQFRFNPLGKKHIMVCRGTACHINDSLRILEEIESILGIKPGETTSDLEYSLETVACIGACSQAPTLMIDKKVIAKLDNKKVRNLFN